MSLTDLLGVADQPWMSAALCTQVGPEDWFPEKHFTDDTASALPAKAVCRRCPVKVKCLSWQMEWEGDLAAQSRHGIFGGMTPQERARLARGTTAGACALDGCDQPTYLDGKGKPLAACSPSHASKVGHATTRAMREAS